MHAAQRFEGLLEAYRRPDGGRWTGQQLDEATGGVVTRSYVTNLRKGRIESPGYEKMRAIALAKGFPPEAWFDETPRPVERPAWRARTLPSGSRASSRRSGTRARVSPIRTRKSPE